MATKKETVFAKLVDGETYLIGEYTFRKGTDSEVLEVDKATAEVLKDEPKFVLSNEPFDKVEA